MIRIASIVATSILAAAALAQPRGVRLEREPRNIPAAGISVQIPEDGLIQGGPVDSPILAEIRHPGSPWVVRVQTPRTAGPEAPPGLMVDRIVEELSSRYGVFRAFVDPQTHRPKDELIGTRLTIVERSPNLVISDRLADRVYLRAPEEADRGETFMGFTAIRLEPERLLVLEVEAPANSEQEARLVYETIVASVRFADPQSVIADRGRLVNRGIEMLSLLSSEDVDAAIALNAERWERLSIPAATGADSDATELGYRRLMAWRGERGEVFPEKPRSRWETVDRDPGILIRMEARVLENSGGGRGTIDTLALYFVSDRGDSESWNVRMTRRGPAGKATYSELAVRTGNDLLVSVEGTGQPAKTIRPLFESLGYLGQVQGFLLPQLLVRVGLESDYAFYAYRTADQRVTLRRDSIDRPTERPGTWRISTSFSEGTEPQVTLLDAGGRFLQTELPDGRMWEATTLDRLTSLWRSKNLPLD